MAENQTVQFKAQEILFREGDSSRDLYVIRSGTVEVSKAMGDKNIPIAMLGKGSFVGEMSFISGLPRSATVSAVEDVEASIISPDVLQADVFGINDWAVNIARVIIDRIRKTTNLIGEYRTGDSQSDNKMPQELINEFGMRDETFNQGVVIYLKGYFTQQHLDELKKVLRTYSARGYQRVILDFSDVPDVDKGVLDFLTQVARDHRAYTIEVSIKNVQLIRNRILAVNGIEHIMAKSRLPLKRIAQHDYLIRQNEVETVMYVVKSGRFSITREVEGEEILLGYAEAGDVIGEMNLINEGTRSANVRAEQACVVYEVSIHDFKRNLYHIPNWFMEIMRVLVIRLRQTNDMLEQEVRKQSDEPAPVQTDSRICIQMDSGKPGKIVIRGNFVQGNLEYLSTMVNLLIKRGVLHMSVDLEEIEEIDYTAIRYLLKLYVYLQKRGGLLQIGGAQSKIVYLFRQYDIELPRQVTKR